MARHMTTGLTIGEFAALAGVGVETIRFYQRRSLLPEPPRREGRIRRYGTEDVQRLQFVRSAQALGFTLDEVAELLTLEDGAHCEKASVLAETKLADVRKKMANLARIESALASLVQACHVSRGKLSCPLIASLHATG